MKFFKFKYFSIEKVFQLPGDVKNKTMIVVIKLVVTIAWKQVGEITEDNRRKQYNENLQKWFDRVLVKVVFCYFINVIDIVYEGLKLSVGSSCSGFEVYSKEWSDRCFLRFGNMWIWETLVLYVSNC